MFANWHVPDVVPSSTKYGDSPNDDLRLIIRMCCGRYETSMPSKMNLYCQFQWFNSIGGSLSHAESEIHIVWSCKLYATVAARRKRVGLVNHNSSILTR